MKSLLKRLIGANRPRVIAVVGLTLADVVAGVAHALTAGETLPVRTWCAEDAGALEVLRGLRSVWPALVIVSWTGRRGNLLLKLVPLTVPPFRVVIFNEAGGFFSARPAPVIRHLSRRVSNAVVAGARRCFEVGYSLMYRGAQRTRDVLRLGWSLIYRLRERFEDHLLAALAFVAQLTPAMAGAMYRRMEQDEAMPVALPPAAGRTVVEIKVNGRRWPGRAVRKASADFIVFRKPGETGSAEALIEAALFLNAFAVAKQLAWTGWRDRVVTKHPFRRLSLGEMSRVQMPFSSLVVVRRDSLPRAITFGASLMLLSRKAGPSFVMGHDEPITQEPAMPLEDLEFVLRTRGLKRFDSPLARGNVVSSPSHAKPFRGLPRVLVVSPYLPFPLSHGGAVRMYNLCRALANEVDFVLACFREANETVRYAELHEVFREVYTVDIDEKGEDPTVPKQVATYRNSAMRALIRSIPSDIVQLEYTQMAEYRACAEGRPTILVEHDITFTLYQQLGRDFEIWERFESEALKHADLVWTMSEQDRELATKHGASAQAIPNGVDLRRFQPLCRETPGQAVLFVGSFRHLPNLLACEALLQTIMPEVWKQFPECRLNVIAGPNHERWARTAGKGKLLAPDSRVSMQGFVEDVFPAYRECDVVAIPLPVSAGTNIKLIEAMACGRAIVSTPVGCHGLDLEDGVDLLVSDMGPDFADAICCLLADRSKREQIAARACRTAQARFDWDIIAREALSCYKRLEKRP